jgi:hypothetical protein
MKTCTKCNKEKALAEFSLSKGKHISQCKECVRANSNLWYAKNKEKHCENSKEWYSKNRDRKAATIKKWYAENKEYVSNLAKQRYLENSEAILAKGREWYRNNREKDLAKGREWYKSNKHVTRANTAKYKSRKIERTPAWLDDEELFLIKEVYHLASLRTKATGFAWEVDHIIPLQGKNVCGLHVLENLQVIPMKENRQKSNRFFLTA